MKAVRMGAAALGVIFIALCIDSIPLANGGQATDEMQRLQQQLNNEIMSRPFSVADEARVKAYIQDAQKRGEVPAPYTGKHWKPGCTCADLRPYSYREYLACRYYHFYYGRYYP